jgi:prepilin peptidase CpaA
MSTFLTSTAAAFLPVLLVWAGALDILTRSIPNTIVLCLVVCFGIFAIADRMAIGQVLEHAVCGGIVLFCGYLLFSISMMGGGDAKLLAGSALWFGFDNILPLIAAISLAGGVLAVIYIALNAIRHAIHNESAPVRAIPYGAAIATGALAVVPDWVATL